MAVSTVEGVGLGILGIGLPDIVLFLSVILKGTYETALQYGFSYDTPEERMYILRLLETAMSKGEQWIACNMTVDNYFFVSLEYVFSIKFVPLSKINSNAMQKAFCKFVCILDGILCSRVSFHFAA